MKKQWCVSVFLLAAALLLSGCGNYIGKEKTHPLFVKAGSSRVAGNYKEAAQYFEEFLTICPKSPLAHYELASVYADNLDEPFQAIYHYEKYLELSPESPDVNEVRKFIEICRKRLFDRLSQTYESTATETAHQETAKVKKLLDEYIAYSSKLEKQNAQMREIIYKKKVVRQVNVQPLRDNGPTADAARDPFAGTQTQVTTNTARTEVREYTVKSGDTLSKISKTVYGDKKYYPLIRKANMDQLGQNGVLRVGMKLKIPSRNGAAE